MMQPDQQSTPPPPPPARRQLGGFHSYTISAEQLAGMLTRHAQGLPVDRDPKCIVDAVAQAAGQLVPAPQVVRAAAIGNVLGRALSPGSDVRAAAVAAAAALRDQQGGAGAGSLQGLGAEERRAAEDELINAWGEMQRRVVVPDALFMRVRGPPPSATAAARTAAARPCAGAVRASPSWPCAQGLATAVGKGILVLHLCSAQAAQCRSTSTRGVRRHRAPRRRGGGLPGAARRWVMG
jgi:hypothetical protein